MLKKFLLLFAICIAAGAFAQQSPYATVYGTVRDSAGNAIADVNVIVVGTDIMAFTKEDGTYRVNIPADKEVELAFTYVSRPTYRTKIGPLKSGDRFRMPVTMSYGINLSQFVFTEEKDRDRPSTITINAREIKQLPNVSGSFEQVLKTLPGVTSNNELSSQYNVRGGNYDENLIYVNDIEIYRPFLPRSGQSEGLSFIHTELVQNIRFSAGGFEARYGDKMSSVLDIKYKDPKKFAASGNVSLMGAQGHAEGATKNLRFTYLLSARYWTNRYVLSSLDVSADYKPTFSDVQTLLTWHVTDKLSISALGGYAKNNYLVIPQTRETSFGTVKQAMQLRMYFEGQDLMQYQTATGALSVNFQPDRFTQLKLISSIFNSNEREFFTIEGAYRLEEVETDFGNDNFGKARATKGIGYFLNNARNQVNATVYNVGHRGYRTIGNHNLQWGAQFQGEHIKDKLSEWDYKDSLGFAQPSQVNGQPVVLNYLNSNVSLMSHRVSGYVQNSQKLNRDYNLTVTYGIRSNWWSYNNENVISPRIQLSIEPNRKYNRAIQNGTVKGKLRRDINLKAAWGYYYQPPFYRELRDFSGTPNPNIKAQKAIHYVLGGDMNFNLWNRKFRFFAETYYKKLENLIPYEIDNVRIRYYATNNAEGYAAGIDMRVNGEFVKGAESWMSLSVMKTQERITTVDASGNKTTSPYIPRPTDQRATFSMFFQDYLPQNDKYKVNITFVFGSGLPFGPPDRNREGDTLRMPSYRRVDIGFLRMLIDEKDKDKKGWKRHIRSAWIGVDVFNLLAINNTISHIWIEDIEGRTWAVPNYLTNRRVNLRLMVNF
jgi:hypothetical protein